MNVCVTYWFPGTRGGDTASAVPVQGARCTVNGTRQTVRGKQANLAFASVHPVPCTLYLFLIVPYIVKHFTTFCWRAAINWGKGNGFFDLYKLFRSFFAIGDKKILFPPGLTSIWRYTFKFFD
jgi:hypothetical protein